MKLFPLLSRTQKIDELVVELINSSVSKCLSRRAFSHPAMTFSPTGGIPASEQDLDVMASGLTDIAKRFGYPATCEDTRSTDAFWSEFLHKNVQISAHEAAKDEVWNFVTCILVPDLVKWRWSLEEDDAEGPTERWVTIRRRGRNCFGRLWWRAEILVQSGSSVSYGLLHELKEDEFVQIMERPSLAGNKSLSLHAASELVEYGKRKPKSNRTLIFREVQKRLLRVGAYLEFQAIPDDKIRSLILELFIQSEIALQRNEANSV